MQKKDGRQLTRQALEERRRIIIRMKKNGCRAAEIVEATGCSRQAIYPLWNTWKKSKSRHKEDGIITVKKCGKRPGCGRTLTAQQEKRIQNAIKDKYPDQLKLDFALWTREAVKLLIKELYGINMPIRTVGEYLKRWHYTAQRPVKYAYERDPEKVGEWLENTYPKIKKRAKREKADIYWADETTLKASDVRGRGYGPKGKTPVVNRTEKKENVSMVSAITNKGKVFWKLYEGSINGQKFREFAERLVYGKRRKVFLILDNAKPHHSKVLREWVEKTAKRIAVFYLPPYSPDLNPDEHVNADVKYGVGSRTPKKTEEALREATEEHMKMLRDTPERIIQYFLDPAISYAANV
jgi:transposase